MSLINALMQREQEKVSVCVNSCYKRNKSHLYNFAPVNRDRTIEKVFRCKQIKKEKIFISKLIIIKF